MRILFQGDSITDASRSRENDHFPGMGYPTLVKAFLGFSEPGKHEFFNRGISGNRIVDIYARMKCDILQLKPDVMSILIGVNDVWHDLAAIPNGVDAEKFFRVYDMLIEEIKQELPQVKIMILEPFFLKTPNWEENAEFMIREVKLRGEMAKKIAEKHSLPFVPLQEGFNDLCKQAPAEYWLRDGVHPTAMGHEYIKRQWLSAYENL